MCWWISCEIARALDSNAPWSSRCTPPKHTAAPWPPQTSQPPPITSCQLFHKQLEPLQIYVESHAKHLLKRGDQVKSWLVFVCVLKIISYILLFLNAHLFLMQFAHLLNRFRKNTFRNFRLVLRHFRASLLHWGLLAGWVWLVGLASAANPARLSSDCSRLGDGALSEQLWSILKLHKMKIAKI